MESKLVPESSDGVVVVVEDFENEDLKRLVALLDPVLQKQVLVRDMLEMYFAEKGYKYVESNIIYSKRHAKKPGSGLLAESLKNDYGEAIRAELEVKQEKENREREKALAEQKKANEEREEFKLKVKKAKDYFETLPKSEQNQILKIIKTSSLYKLCKEQDQAILAYFVNNDIADFRNLYNSGLSKKN